jgi:hypothetical protein
VDNVLGGNLESDMRYITFEDFEPAELCPFYPLTTRDMRRNPDQYWKPDARVDRALWQRITDYIRGIVTTDGEFLRDKIGVTASAVWERAGPIKTDPDDPETWEYKSGDQDLLRGMQSGRYRPADWLYLNLVGEYHRIIGKPTEDTIPEITSVTGYYTRYWHKFTFAAIREIHYQYILYPYIIAQEDFSYFPFGAPAVETWTEVVKRNLGISQIYRTRDLYSEFSNNNVVRNFDFDVVLRYEWNNDVTSINESWNRMKRQALISFYRSIDPILLHVLAPHGFVIKITKRSNYLAKAELSYKLDDRELYGGTISVRYGSSSQELTPRYYYQSVSFDLVGPKFSQHIIYIDYSPNITVVFDGLDEYKPIYRENKYWMYQRLVAETQDTIGEQAKYKYHVLVNNIPFIYFKVRAYLP